MSGVENRIVTMQFNNREFESNAKTSLATMQKLKESMSFGTVAGGSIRALGTIQSALSKIGLKTPFAPMIASANKGLNGIGFVLDKLGMKNPFVRGVQGASDMKMAAQQAAGPAGMGSFNGAVTGVSKRFVVLSTVAITALSNIANRAVNAGIELGKSLTIAPIKQGFDEYELKMGSIQTMLANTARYGTKLPEIMKNLNELNTYADKTIYNFGDMTKNIGLFTNAGLRIGEATSMIKGFSNSAAASGTTAQGAAGAAYQLSQALSAGTIRLMDWRSLTNVGMGNKNMQQDIVNIADAMGVLDKAGTSSKEVMSNFNASLEKQWLSKDVMSKYLLIMAGDMDKAKMAALGLNDAQIKTMLVNQKNAEEAATKVRTWTQLIGTLQEGVGSTWAETFELIIGNFNTATELWSRVSDTLGAMINKMGNNRNQMLKDWQKGGGRDIAIDGLVNSWNALLGILGPIRDGFRDIFPAKTGQDLLDMTKSFESFTEKLIPGKAAMEDIRDIAGGVFAVFGIAKTILSGVITMLGTIFGSVEGGGRTFLDLAAGVGRTLVSLNDFLETSGVVTAFFKGLGGILSIPLNILKGIGALITSIFSGFDSAATKFGKSVNDVGHRLSGLQAIGENIGEFFSRLGELFGKVGEVIGKSLVGVGDVVAGAFTPETFGATLDVINTTLLGALVLLIKNFFQKGVKIDIGGGLFSGIKKTLGEATGAFSEMQKSLKADILLKIAAAIGVMALSLLVLSGIDPKALSVALGAMTGGFAILIGAMATLIKVMGPAGLVQLYVVTAAMTKMSFSILLLASALKILASIDFGSMLRGLFGLSIMMRILTKAMLPLAAGSKGMGRAAFSLILVGVAINILAVALKTLSSMSWEELIRGLAGLTGVLLALSVGLKLLPPMKAEAIGLIALGVALNLLAVAMKIFATMGWEEIAKGLVATAGSLLIIAAAIRLMPKTMILQATALLVVAGALTILAGALKIMGSMGWGEIAKGMVLLAGSMVILAVGLQAIGVTGAIGAAGLLVAAGALAIFAPVMLAFGAMKWSTILKSLTMLAGIFVILGVAGAVLAPLTPVIIGLGAALLLMGAGLALAGSGALAAATAFAIVVSAGAAGIQILVGFLGAIVSAIPPALVAFAKGLAEFAKTIGLAAPTFALAAFRILNAFLDQVIKIIPKLGKIMLRVVDVMINVIMKSAPKLAAAGAKMIIGLLNAAQKNVGKITDSATKLVVNFLGALGRNLPKIIDAGLKFVISFINGTATAIRKNKEKMADAGRNLASALIEAAVAGLRGGAKLIKDAAMNAARQAWQAAKDFFKIGGPSRLWCETIGKPMMEGWRGGIARGRSGVVDEVEDLGIITISKINDVMDGMNDAFALDPNFNPTVTPVLDLTALTKEANKMSSILAVAPIMPTVSYQAAADVSSFIEDNPVDGKGGPGQGPGGGGDIILEQHLHSPKPIDSVQSYRAGKSLISLAKEALS